MQSNHKKSQGKSAMAQSTHMQSMSKSVRKQIDKQPEVARNSKHVVLPTHVPYVGPQLMLQDSTSKHCFPAVIENLCPDSRSYRTQSNHMWPVNPVEMQSNHMQPVKDELKKKSQVNTVTSTNKQIPKGH